MSNSLKTLLIVSSDELIAKLFDTFTIEKTYSTPLTDFSYTHIYIASSFPNDARIIKSGYIGKIKSTTISPEDGRWSYKFVMSEILTAPSSKGLPRNTEKTESGGVFEADLSVYLSPPELDGAENPDLKINSHEENRLLTITDAINRVAETYNISPSDVKISISGSATKTNPIQSN